MKQTLIIVDDFYANPDAVRAQALDLTYEAMEGHTYPGANSTTAINPPGQVEAFKKILGAHIEPSKFGLFGHFRTSLESDSYEQDIHVDPPAEPGEMIWAAVLYMNTPEQCRQPDGTTKDGTLLWRHIARDLERTPMSQEEGEAWGFKDYNEVREKIVYEDGHDRSKWELMHRVPMKYNRAVFFRPVQWHSHGENFGTTLENGRLVQIFFFRTTRGNA